MKYSAFKAKFADWKYDYETSVKAQLSIVRDKQMKIWNFIGDRVCKYYQDKKGIPIQFVPATN